MSLDDLRKKIDSLDDKIVRLLNERANYSKKIGETKRKVKSGIYAPHREREILDRLKKINQGPM